MPPVCPAHSGIDARVTAVEEEVADHRVMLRRLQNRPPAWVTLVIGLLTFALGWTVSLKPAVDDHAPAPRTQQSTETRNY
jgi:hypothetical protein